MIRPLVLDRSVVVFTGAFATVKGTLIAIIAFGVTSDLGSSLLIAVTSGTLGILGMVLSAWVSTKAIRQHIEPRLDTIQQSAEDEASKQSEERERVARAEVEVARKVDRNA